MKPVILAPNPPFRRPGGIRFARLVRNAVGVESEATEAGVGDWVATSPPGSHAAHAHYPTRRQPLRTPAGADTDEEMAALRDEYLSGRRVLTQHKSVGYMTDALTDAPDYHVSKSTLADQAGVSRQSMYTHLPLLRRLGIVSVVEDSSPEQYTLDSGDELVRELHRLSGLVNEKLEGG